MTLGRSPLLSGPSGGASGGVPPAYYRCFRCQAPATRYVKITSWFGGMTLSCCRVCTDAEIEAYAKSADSFMPQPGERGFEGKEAAPASQWNRQRREP